MLRVRLKKDNYAQPTSLRTNISENETNVRIPVCNVPSWEGLSISLHLHLSLLHSFQCWFSTEIYRTFLVEQGVGDLARNTSSWICLQWPSYLVNSLDKTKYRVFVYLEKLTVVVALHVVDPAMPRSKVWRVNFVCRHTPRIKTIYRCLNSVVNSFTDLFFSWWRWWGTRCCAYQSTRQEQEN